MSRLFRNLLLIWSLLGIPVYADTGIVAAGQPDCSSFEMLAEDPRLARTDIVAIRPLAVVPERVSVKFPINGPAKPASGSISRTRFHLDPSQAERIVPDLFKQAGYSEIKLVASGGMGSVFQVKNSAGERKIIKVLHRNGDIHVNAFDHEARIMNLLSMTNNRFLGASRIDFVGQEDAVLRAIEMDFIPLRPGSDEPAISLARALKEPLYMRGKHEMRESIQRQYRMLLLTAHRLGISHLDIKPANMLLSFDEKGEVKLTLIDWGLSHGQGDFASPFVARGNVVGTAGYFPAEKWAGGDRGVEDDIYASRIVDWHLRTATHDLRENIVLRYPFPEPPDRTRRNSEVSMVPQPEDASGFDETYKEPAVAQDMEGTLRERIVAMAEWSRLPNTILERERLLVEAKLRSEEQFLADYGQRLRAMPGDADAAGTGMRHGVTSEILSSTVLIEHLAPDRGLKLDVATIESVARTAAFFHHYTWIYRTHPNSLGPLGPHPKLHYDLFAQKIDELAARGLIKPWSHWLKEQAKSSPNWAGPPIE